MDDIYQMRREQVREHEQVREQGRKREREQEWVRVQVQVREREQVRVHQQLRFFHPSVLGLLVGEGYLYRGYFHTASR